MSETGAQLDFGLDKGVSVVLERKQEDLLHLVSELAEAGERMRRDRSKHLRAKRLEDFLCFIL